jgi:hypothetical protein
MAPGFRFTRLQCGRGGLGSHRPRGGPRQRLIRVFHNRINGLEEIKRCGPKGRSARSGSARGGANHRAGVGGAEIRPKPLRNEEESLRGNDCTWAIHFLGADPRVPARARGKNGLTPSACRPCAGRRNRWFRTRPGPSVPKTAIGGPSGWRCLKNRRPVSRLRQVRPRRDRFRH